MTSRFLTTAEACEYLRFTNKHKLRSLYYFIEQRGIRTQRRGHRLLILRSDLDKAIGASDVSARKASVKQALAVTA